jgi:hypothetical protein
MKKYIALALFLLPHYALAYGDVVFVKPSGVVWAFSALLLSMVIVTVYVAIFFFILFVIAYGIMKVLSPIMHFLYD